MYLRFPNELNIWEVDAGQIFLLVGSPDILSLLLTL